MISSWSCHRGEKNLGMSGCRLHNEPSHFLLRHRRVTTWPPSQAIVVSWRDITYQVMMLLFVTSTKGDNPRYIRWYKFSLCHMDWCRISMICTWKLDAKKLASHLLRDLNFFFHLKKSVGILWTKNVDTSTWAKTLIRKEFMIDILHLLE